ncbi:hypothetical protein [Gracilimonas sp.]|uniref:hypothetical protein n=1 Tax=Gracilimonas sp. TaxID=1974203 RepID=UPI002871E8D7|nr:hypothetical protein [Gracilimonas sp.]
MTWIKDAWLDVIILLFIISLAFYSNSVLEIVLWVYTALLLLSKLLALFMPSLQRRANKSEAPSLFYHIIYGITVAVLLYSGFYYLAGAWIIVWGISAYNFVTTNKSNT